MTFLHENTISNNLSHNLKSFLQSLKYDANFITSSYPASIKEKISFLSIKHYLLLKHYILKRPIRLGSSSVNINEHRFFYETSLGISGFQTMIVNFEKSYSRYLDHLKKPIIIDVGAHIGFFSRTAARFFPQAIIYACEPVNVTFKLLKKNCKKINSIKPFKVGFADKKSKSKILFVKNKLAYSSLFAERFLWTNNPNTEEVEIDTLDNFQREQKIERVDILKIDTEGAEEKILKGAHKTLSKTRYLIIECALDLIGGTTFSSLIKNLYSSKFNFHLISLGSIMHNPQGEIAVLDLLFENTNITNNNKKRNE